MFHIYLGKNPNSAIGEIFAIPWDVSEDLDTYIKHVLDGPIPQRSFSLRNANRIVRKVSESLKSGGTAEYIAAHPVKVCEHCNGTADEPEWSDDPGGPCHACETFGYERKRRLLVRDVERFVEFARSSGGYDHVHVYQDKVLGPVRYRLP